MFKSKILSAAKQDIKASAIWYESKQKGLGKRFTTEIREKVRSIQENPRAAPIRFGNVRTAVLVNFPFMIHYTDEVTLKKVTIIAVFHTSRNPDVWKERS